MKIDTNTRFTLELSIDEIVEVHSALVSERSDLAAVLQLGLDAMRNPQLSNMPIDIGMTQPRPPHFAGGK